MIYLLFSEDGWMDGWMYWYRLFLGLLGGAKVHAVGVVSK
jgi:hypothetical protein